MLKKFKSIFYILNKDQKNSFFFLLFLMITTSFLEILSIVVLLDFVNFFIMSENSNYFSVVTKFAEKFNINFISEDIFQRGLITIIFLLLSIIFALLEIYFSVKFAFKTGGEIESRLFEYYLKRDYLFHIETSSANLLNRINELVKRITLFVITPCLTVISKLFFLAPLLIGLFLFTPLVSMIACFIFFVIYFLVYAIFKKRLKLLGDEETNITKNKYQILQEGFGGIKETKILNKFNYFKSNFKKNYLAFVNVVIARDVIARYPKYFIEGLTFVTTIVLVISLTQNNSISLNEIIFTLSFFIICAYKIIPAFQQIYRNTVTIQNHIIVEKQIVPDLIEAKKIEENEKIKNEDRSNKFKNFQKIQIKNLNFNYQSSKVPTLENISLEISKGDRIAVTGLSGSGKTTFIHILIGLIKQQSGEIFIDKKKITSSNFYNWQKLIGFVPQSVFLSDKSIRENIAFGEEKKKINQNKINEVLNLSMLKQTVENLSEKDDTKIGEGGVKLSGGQQQRLAIARALYFDPEFIVFDEATNSLDSLTENDLLDSLDNLDKKITIAMIVHNVEIIKKFKKIIFLNNGKVEGFGSFNTLVDENKNFRELVNSSNIK